MNENEDRNDSLENGKRYVPVRNTRKVPLVTAVVVALALAAGSVILCSALLSQYYRGKLGSLRKEYSDKYEELVDAAANESDAVKALKYVEGFVNRYAYVDGDYNTRIYAMLNAYLQSSGDVHSAYFDASQTKLNDESAIGQFVGVGVTMRQTDITVNGQKRESALVLRIVEDSPASESGILPGDLLVGVKENGEEHDIYDCGYATFSSFLKGEEGSTFTLTVLRRDGEGEYSIRNDIEITRRRFVNKTVTAHMSETSPDTAIVKISEFNYKTPDEFYETVVKMKDAGAEYFVFDLRDNPGGYIVSLEKTLHYFLNEGDVMVSTKDKDNNELIDKVPTGEDAKSLKVGVFKDLKFSVLVNERSASAAELFTANMRDYGLGNIVGVKTYGKGSVQNVWSLQGTEVGGSFKFTVKHYFPPSGVGYDGIGVIPQEEYTVESDLGDEEFLDLLPESRDLQLMRAISAAKEEVKKP